MHYVMVLSNLLAAENSKISHNARTWTDGGEKQQSTILFLQEINILSFMSFKDCLLRQILANSYLVYSCVIISHFSPHLLLLMFSFFLFVLLINSLLSVFVDLFFCDAQEHIFGCVHIFDCAQDHIFIPLENIMTIVTWHSSNSYIFRHCPTK